MPRLASLCIFSSAMAENGISRGAKMSFFCSFIITAAQRVVRLSAMPQAILAKVFIEHGAMIMASTPNEPEAMEAEMSSLSWSSTFCISFARTVLEFCDIMKCFSIEAGSNSITFSPRFTPLAPLVATTIFCFFILPLLCFFQSL